MPFKGPRVLKDETGNEYGILRVVKRATNLKTAAAWECQCECGRVIVVRGSGLRHGVQSCGCLRTKAFQERNRLAYGEAAKRRARANIQANAVRRGYVWEIDDETAYDLMAQNCFYCGLSPSNVSAGRYGNYKYNGIDRLDNTKGYLPDNVVACCAQCNRAKLDSSLPDFLSWASRLVAHQRKV